MVGARSGTRANSRSVIKADRRRDQSGLPDVGSLSSASRRPRSRDTSGRYHAAFARDLVGNAQTFEQLGGKVHAAGAVGIGDRFGFQKRAPQRVNGADVRLGGARPNGNADA